MVWICISLIITNIKILFMNLLAICIFFFRMIVFSGLLSIFKWNCLVFMLLILISFLYILDINILSDLVAFFILLMISFAF